MITAGVLLSILWKHAQCTLIMRFAAGRRKTIHQWQCSFHLKAVLSLVKRIATVLDRCSDTGPGGAEFYITVNMIMFSSHLTNDDVTKWKHFPRYRPFVRGNHRPPVNSAHKGRWRRVWCFLWSAPEQTVVQIIGTPAIWDAIALIMTSL